MKDWENKIYYSQCWEDPKVLMEALAIEPNSAVLSVTSGGCNTLALLLENPTSIIAFDINPIQNYLFELKIAALKNLDYNEFLEFVGVSNSDSRMAIFKKIKSNLTPRALKWWLENQRLIEKGIIHSGKFEKYLSIFRKHILPLIHSKKTIQKLSSLKNLAEQRSFYKDHWANWQWRFLFKIFFSGFTMSLLGRNRALFKYVGIKNIGEHYFIKTEYALTKIPMEDNFFMEYILYGTYRSQKRMPPYLQEKNFSVIKERLNRIKVVTANIKGFLLESTDNKFSGFNLSNVFEAQSSSVTEDLFTELARVSKNQGRLVYWNNLVERKFPDTLRDFMKDEVEIENRVKAIDRVFFYNNLHVNTVTKNI